MVEVRVLLGAAVAWLLLHPAQATPAAPAAGAPTRSVWPKWGVDGYTSSTYGDAFADVYDDWYADVSDVEAMVALIADLAGSVGDPAAPVLELGVGTGRLAVPLARRGVAVEGIDASEAMLAKLREREGAAAVRTHLGDMVDDLPDGPFSVVFAAFNTFFNVLDDDRQRRCFHAVGERLVGEGWFVIEAFVPEPRSGSAVEVRSMSVDHVVLSVSRYDAEAQSAQGQYVSIDARGVRLRPWAIRYATPAQLDVMAAAAGLAMVERWEDARRTPFADDSPRHVTLYRPKPRSVPSGVGSTS